MNDDPILARIGTTRERIMAIAGTPIPTLTPPPKKMPRAKRAEKVMKMRARKIPVWKIAEACNVGPSTVNRILRHERSTPKVD